YQGREFSPGDPEIMEQRTIAQRAAAMLKDIPPDENAMKAWQERADFFHVARRYDDAVIAINKALEIEPDNSEALMRKGAVLCEMRRTADGMAVYQHLADRVLAKSAV